MPKIGFISLGCPKNRVDSEVMLGLLGQRGFEITDQESQADILVVNTCGFIGAARGESVEAILEASRWKEEGRCRKLIVAGCLVEKYRDEIRREIPEVDAVIGPNQIAQIADLCSQPAYAPLLADAPFLYDDTTPRVLTTGKHYAYLKVAEGCDHPCAFCIIPQLRGPFRSRRPDSVVREAAQLARQGVREINLVGQDTTMYGRDLQPRSSLAALLRGLDAVEGIEWIRFLYCYPHSTTGELLETVAELPKVCKYFDIPFQHASARVLKRMRRGGDPEFLLRMLETIRSRVPGAALRSTLIVGFPGETDEDFGQLLQFVRQAQLDHLGVFVYSDEESSAAFHLSGKVPTAVARRRRDCLMRLQQKISLQRNRGRIGKRVEAILDGPSAETDLLWQGRMQTQAPEIDGCILVNDGPEGAFQPGKIVTIEITEAHPYDLVGRIVGAA